MDRVQSGTSDEGWAIYTDDCLVVPQLIDLREEILRELYCCCFAVHPGETKCIEIFVANIIGAG